MFMMLVMYFMEKMLMLLRDKIHETEYYEYFTGNDDDDDGITDR